jgi:urease accessory protein UreF
VIAVAAETLAMTLVDKIPTLSDEEVINLLANAQRLVATGDERQQAAAAELLPALETAAVERREARLAAAQLKRAAARKPRSVAA